jgi:hypothetical protein
VRVLLKSPEEVSDVREDLGRQDLAAAAFGQELHGRESVNIDLQAPESGESIQGKLLDGIELATLEPELGKLETNEGRVVLLLHFLESGSDFCEDFLGALEVAAAGKDRGLEPAELEEN